ncbi:MAG: PEP-CTERM sorting domain-containing protein [Phycisphaeraceae bacterium]|nr:PEP-CTERM sorting domain-containing protein [Phycisphaeraceae bacterium]
MFSSKCSIPWTTVAVGFCVVVCVSAAQAAVVSSHVGANDPTTEGWSLTKSVDNTFGGNWSTVGPLSPDPDFDLTNSWQIDHYLSEVWYSDPLTVLQQNDAAANGWRFTGIFRLEEALDNATFDNGICDLIVITSQLGFSVRVSMDLGATAADRTIRNRIDNTYNNVGGDSYYRVIFNYNVGAGTVDYYINDTLINTFATGALTPTEVRFGSINFDSANDGPKDYALVTLETGALGPIPPTPDFGDPVPEPATLGLFGLGLAAVLSRRRS